MGTDRKHVRASSTRSPANPLARCVLETLEQRQLLASTLTASVSPLTIRPAAVIQATNLAPTNITLANTTTAENRPVGALIGTLSGTDPNAGDTFTYTLVSGTGSADNASFTIVSNSLRTTAIFDYETKNSYAIRIRITDQGGLWFEKAFTITVTNVNDAPSDLALSYTSVVAGQPAGVVVGTFSSVDQDPRNTFTYSLVTGTGSDDNSLFTISGNELRTAAVFDLATRSTYSIRVRTTDQGGLFFGKALTITVRPRDMYVDLNAPGPTHNGSSWASAYTDLQLALANAIPANRILVADGTYTPTATADRAISFALKDRVSILGGYAGFGAADPNARNTALYPSILSGDIGITNIKADNSYHVITGNSTITSATILDGLTITGGNANGASPTSYGGGMYLAGSSPTLINCVFTANAATDGGGGIYLNSLNSPSSMSLTGCTFTGNSANFGGGFYSIYASSITLTNCTFRGNSAINAGGMYNNTYAAATLTNTTFINNVGGGMGNTNAATATLIGCSFLANTGRAFANSGVSTLVNSIFVGNSADSGSVAAGGTGTSTTLTNCTFAANSASYGAAIYSSGGGSITAANIIAWGNTSTNGGPVFGTAAVTYSDIQGGLAGTGNLNIDPQFIGNPSPGPDGLWATPDDDYGDLRLRHSSPLLDAGNNGASGLTGITTDLVGQSRFVDSPAISDTGSGTAPMIDLGAYETAPGVYASTDGPYFIRQGTSRVLTGRGSSDAPGELTFAWDWDNDGQYDNAFGPSPTFSSAGYPAGTLPIGLQITDASGRSATVSTTLTVVPSVIYVDDSATGAGTGQSWTDAFPDLQSALNLATAGYEIHVAAGTYRPTSTATRSISFRLRPGVALRGGFAGVGFANPDARDIARYTTTLSGDIGTPGNNSDNSYNVVTADSGITSSTILEGFTITAGNANGVGAQGGGGLYLSYASPTLVNCTFLRNTAIDGGALLLAASSPTLTNCTFVGNTATFNGGAISIDSSSTLTLTNSTFTGNTAGATGGAINSDINASLTLTNCTLTANVAASTAAGGGGIYAPFVTITIANSIIWGNTAPTASQVDGVSTRTFITYSDIQGGWTGTGNRDADPRFVRNPSPGLDRTWGTADDDYGDLHLRAFSPVADGGNNAAPGLTDIATDLAGNPRYIDIVTTPDTGSGTAPLVDMGAYEALPALDALVAGPYIARSGETVALAGFGSGTVAGPLNFAWDWDNDGLYDDATGAAPLYPGLTTAGVVNLPIRLRVTDSGGNSTTASTILTIVPPLLYVDDSATGAGDGSSWDNALTSLQAALGYALPGCEVRVAAGVYTPTTTTDRTVSFPLRSGIRLYGGYAGSGAADPDARNVSLYSSILSGDIGLVGDHADNSYSVITSFDTDANTRLDGFTVTGGNADSGAPETATTSGGGLYARNSSATLANCTFTGNYALDFGGAIYAFSSPLTLIGITFTGNHAVLSGGAIYNDISSPTLTNCTFTRNSASAVGGGAIFNSGSSPLITNSTFFANTTSYNSNGGAIYNALSSPVLINCTFVANVAAVNGGGVYSTYSSWPILTNCTFIANIAADHGGGVYDDPTLTSWGDSIATSTLTNSILWANTAGADPQLTPSTTTIVNYSDIQGGFTGTSNLNADPQFVRSPSPGADALWATADDDYGDLRLRPTSPAIDAGNNIAPGLPGVATDLSGSPRIAGRAVDIGAYESPADLDTTAPAVSTSSISDGAIQRSMVKKLTVTFSEPVTLSTGALTVRLSTGAAVPNLTVTVTNPSADQKTFVLTFTGSAITGGSLPDGIYDLLVTATGVQDLSGNPLTANFSQRFHRLFGDSDGNRIINSLDYARLKQTFGRAPSDPLFNSAFDYEGNNLINALDLARFRQRYGLSFSY